MTGFGNASHAAPRWRSPPQFSATVLAPVRSWLLDDGSLTQHLLDTGRRFSLQRWQQRWECPRPDEALRLNMGPRERALIRQVVMSLDGEPVVFARSVFPARSLSGPLMRLRRLANQSLGSFLFAQQGMRRSTFELRLLRGDHPLIPAQLHQRAPVWTRRSCFRIAGRRLLVAEAFLDAFPRWQAVLPLHRMRRDLVDRSLDAPTGKVSTYFGGDRTAPRRRPEGQPARQPGGSEAPSHADPVPAAIG